MKKIVSKVLISGAFILLGVISVAAASCARATPPPGTATPPLTPNAVTEPSPGATFSFAFTPTPTPPVTSKPVTTVSIEELKQRLEGGHSLAILDVRPRTDFDASHIAKALSLPLQEIPNRYGELPQGTEVIVYAECA